MEQIGTETKPRIYVASLSDYNAGRLHGRWIDADQDAVGIRANITVMLAESKETFGQGMGDSRLRGFRRLAFKRIRINRQSRRGGVVAQRARRNVRSTMLNISVAWQASTRRSVVWKRATAANSMTSDGTPLT